MKQRTMLLTVCFLAMAAFIASAQEAAAPVADQAAVVEETAPVAVAAAVEVGNTVCPVCGMAIDEATKVTSEVEGKVYNLCGQADADEFNKDPQKYIAKVEELKVEEVPAGEPVAAQAEAK